MINLISKDRTRKELVVFILISVILLWLVCWIYRNPSCVNWWKELNKEKIRSNKDLDRVVRVFEDKQEKNKITL